MPLKSALKKNIKIKGKPEFLLKIGFCRNSKTKDH